MFPNEHIRGADVTGVKSLKYIRSIMLPFIPYNKND